MKRLLVLGVVTALGAAVWSSTAIANPAPPDSPRIHIFLGPTELDAETPFHIRHGFLVNPSSEPQTAGQGYAVLMMRPSGAELWNVLARDAFTPSACSSQEFEDDPKINCFENVWQFDGLTAGSYDFRVEWYAPCGANVENGLFASCEDERQILKVFEKVLTVEFVSPLANT